MSDPIDTNDPLVTDEDLEFGAWLAEHVGEVDPDRAFIGAAAIASLGNMKNALNEGADVNTRHPRTGATALHYAASMKARAILLWLGGCAGIDYLIRDKKGRLPSALAYEVASDLVIGRYLATKQADQARARGIDMRTLFTPLRD